jgi:hypothetical protein
MIGQIVQTVPHNELSDRYFNLKGTITNTREEPIYRRTIESGWEPVQVGTSIEYRIEFDSLPDKEMSKVLWLPETMFTKEVRQ